MTEGNTIDQNDIEKLLSAKSGQNGQASQTPTPQATSSSADAADSKVAPQNSTINQSDIEKLLAGSATGGLDAQPTVGGTSAQAVAEPEEKVANIPPTPPQNDDGNKALAQDDIENLLKSTLISSVPQQKVGVGIGMPKGSEDAGIDEGVPQGDIDYLLRRAEEALESITTGNGTFSGTTPEVIEFQFPEFGGSTPNSDHATLDQISEVELDIKIELGRTNMYLEDILKLRKGSVVALDKIAGDAVDIYVNERLIARGEVLVLNDNFCVRVAELLAGAIPIE